MLNQFAYRFGVACLVLTPCVARAVPPLAPETADIRKAVEASLPLLWKGAEGHIAKRDCFACHNQAVPVLAFTTARDRGFKADAKGLQKQADVIAAFLKKNRDNYQMGKGQGGQVDTASYALLTLELAGWKADETTAAVVEYLLLRDKDLDYWKVTSNRPPSEASSFTTTYLATRALRYWATPEQKDRVAKRVDAVRDWLSAAKPKDTEDRVFRLLALKEAGADADDLKEAVEDLVWAQRSDGGWAQLDSAESDPYATGSALVALHLAGGMKTDDPTYKLGVSYLLRSQKPDGSWHVRSRSKPFQLYYESGFPHEKDQFISMAASGWATTALALACPPAKAE